MRTGKSPAVPRTDNDVQFTRSWTGLWVVVAGDVVIALAAIIAVVLISRHSSAMPAVIRPGGSASSGLDTSAMVSILSSAFTAIGTMTTAYFGIRAATNTAQSHMKAGGEERQAGPAPGAEPGTPPPPTAGAQ
jgi:hypothetical protein